MLKPSPHAPFNSYKLTPSPGRPHPPSGCAPRQVAEEEDLLGPGFQWVFTDTIIDPAATSADPQALGQRMDGTSTRNSVPPVRPATPWGRGLARESASVCSPCVLPYHGCFF